MILISLNQHAFYYNKIMLLRIRSGTKNCNKKDYRVAPVVGKDMQTRHFRC